MIIGGKMKKKILIIALLIIALIAALLIIFHQELKLKITGYSIKEIAIIKKKIPKEDLNILNDIYIKNIEHLLNDKNFNLKKLTNYIEYYKKNNDAPYNVIILLVNNNIDNSYDNNFTKIINHKEFDSSRLKRYITYYINNKEINIDSVINLVNKDIDTITMTYTDGIEQLVNETYFKSTNLERYNNYKIKNPNLSYSEIITNVNSNLDYEYYTNVQKADISKNNLILVNKYYKLDNNYVPDNLVTIDTKYGYAQQLKKEAYDAFVKMADAANKEGLGLYIRSPYRSYNTQLGLYQNYVKQNGQKEADTYSARAGYSEHQTGLAVDVMAKANVIADLGTFESTNEFTWMKNHCHEYGFILRYPKGKEYITGYIYEPWHYRYVGIEVANKIKELNITYEEYYEFFIK